jgi:hypothetical protein
MLPGVEPDAGKLDRTSDGLLVHIAGNQQFTRRTLRPAGLMTYEPNAIESVYICAQVLR